jgi:hypothetical protein
MPETLDDYLAANPYAEEGDTPAPDSPRRRLPVPHRQVWAAVQDGLRTMPRVREAVVWSDRGWRWSWLYSCDDRAVAYLVPTERGVLGALVVQERNLGPLLGHKDVTAKMADRIRTAPPEGEGRTCWVPVLDVDTAREFLLSVRATLDVMRAARTCAEGPAGT